MGTAVTTASAAPSRARHARELRTFLRSLERPEHPLDGVDERTSLIDAGIIDSLAVLEIVAYLEGRYGFDVADNGIDPEELTSIGGILELIERLGG